MDFYIHFGRFKNGTLYEPEEGNDMAHLEKYLLSSQPGILQNMTPGRKTKITFSNLWE